MFNFVHLSILGNIRRWDGPQKDILNPRETSPEVLPTLSLSPHVELIRVLVELIQGPN